MSETETEAKSDDRKMSETETEAKSDDRKMSETETEAKSDDRKMSETETEAESLCARLESCVGLEVPRLRLLNYIDMDSLR